MELDFQKPRAIQKTQETKPEELESENKELRERLKVLERKLCENVGTKQQQ